jgi:hypothetical protein
MCITRMALHPFDLEKRAFETSVIPVYVFDPFGSCLSV